MTRTPQKHRSPAQILADWRSRPVYVNPRDIRYPGAVIAQAVLDFSDPCTFPGAFMETDEARA